MQKISNHNVVLLLFGFVVMYCSLILFVLHIVHPKQSSIAKAQSSNFVTKVPLSGKTKVAEKEVAAKLDLERKVIVPSSPQQVSKIAALVSKNGGTIEKTSNDLLVVHIPKDQEANVTQQLNSSKSVKTVGVDYPVAVTADREEWGVSKIKAPDVWPTTTAQGIKVAVIDTGIDYTHPDLKGEYAGGYDEVNKDSDPMDDNGHGTHVSGIIAATADNGGYVGVAPGVQILAVKALGADGTGYISDVVSAVDWAMQHGAQVINFSLGSTYNSSILESKLNEAASKGIILVAAAGNTNGGPLTYPAAYSSVISVAATDQNDNLASFSSVGAEVAAPGVNITSTVPGGYATWSGTSMAAPHVTGTVALMIANHQTNIRDELHKTAVDLGAAGQDSMFGYGLIDAKPAALGLDTQAPLITILSPDDGSTVNSVVPISLSVQDESSIKSTTLYINNIQTAEWTSTPSAYMWDTRTVSDGTYEIRTESTDEYNNVGQAKVMVTVSQNAVITPSSTSSATIAPWLNQGQSSDVRQDINNANAEANRQNYDNMPSQSNSSNSNSQQSTPSQNSTQQNNTQSVPDTTNMNERNQKADEAPGQAQATDHGKGVQGVKTVSWVNVLTSWLHKLFF